MTAPPDAPTTGYPARRAIRANGADGAAAQAARGRGADPRQRAYDRPAGVARWGRAAHIPRPSPSSAPMGRTGPHESHGARIPEGGGCLRRGRCAAAEAPNQ
ncbi:hypothetical protein GCM10027570_23050 [Streptomonospora sediminis]